jgi:hypothetical protein
MISSHYLHAITHNPLAPGQADFSFGVDYRLAGQGSQADNNLRANDSDLGFQVVPTFFYLVRTRETVSWWTAFNDIGNIYILPFKF